MIDLPEEFVEMADDLESILKSVGDEGQLEESYIHCRMCDFQADPDSIGGVAECVALHYTATDHLGFDIGFDLGFQPSEIECEVTIET